MRLFPRLCVASVLLAMSACATRPSTGDADAQADFRERNDPVEPANRFFYAVNDGLDTYVLRPVAVAYRNVVPGAVRRPIHNALTNLSSPVFFANDVFQAKPRRAGDTLMRFLINSTAGGLGLFDVAAGWGYPAHTTDFGITLALWGVGEGPYLFLPVLGPSNPRDAGGYVADIALDPLTYAAYPYSRAVQYTRYGVGLVDARERLIEPVDELKKNSLDPYAAVRSAYRQNRRSAIEQTRNDTRATVPAWFNR